MNYVEPNERARMGGNNPPSPIEIAIEEWRAALSAPVSETNTQTIEQRALALVAASEKARCDDAATAVKCADLASMLQSAIAAVKAASEPVKKSYHDIWKAVVAEENGLLSPLDDAKRRVLGLLTTYQRKLDAEAAAERKRIEDERRAAEAEAAKVGAIVPESAPEIVLPPKIEGDTGAVAGQRTEWKHEITDITKLPANILNSAKVLEAINKTIAAQVKGGIREIPGVRIYSEKVAAVRG